jgi:hypothetical protein
VREKYCWLVAGGWFVLREKYCWLVADKPNEQAVQDKDVSSENYKNAVSLLSSQLKSVNIHEDVR